MTTARNPLMDPAAGDVVRTVSGAVLRVEGLRDFGRIGAWWVSMDCGKPVAVLVTVWRQWVRGGTVVARGGDE